MQRALWAGFMDSAERFPERPAILIEGKTSSYQELRNAACRIASTIQANAEHADPPLTAILGHRSPTGFASVLGALLAGNGYVPLNRTFPAERTQMMFQRPKAGPSCPTSDPCRNWIR